MHIAAVPDVRAAAAKERYHVGNPRTVFLMLVEMVESEDDVKEVEERLSYHLLFSNTHVAKTFAAIAALYE